MLNSNDITTIKQIIKYVKPLTSEFRQYPARKEQIIKKLQPIFGKDSDKWALVIEYNKFVTSFHNSLGKKGRVALKKLLIELDYEHYKDVDFDVD